MRPARTVARPLLSIALLASALAATGCEPVMEVYMSPRSGGGLAVDAFGPFDQIHTVIFLRGGDQSTRIYFRVGSGVPEQPGLSRLFDVERYIYPRPSADQLGPEITLNVQLLGPPVPDPNTGNLRNEPTRAGPWAPGKYEVRVVLQDTDTGLDIQTADVDFIIL